MNRVIVERWRPWRERLFSRPWAAWETVHEAEGELSFTARAGERYLVRVRREGE